ncbi:MAG: peptidoglycan-binding protein [Hyphomicrobiales bacterium]
MKPGIPWSVKGIEPEVREAAKHAARRAGMTLGEWLNTVILDQSDDVAADKPPAAARREDFFGNDMRAPARREETTVRLEDIAQQLSQLAQRERESAAILPYEAPRAGHEDSATLNRIIERIDGNERQTVEAFTAVNERLSVLGRQIAMAPKPVAYESPEEVPGYTALETAIRNVVEHLELSDKRTRESLRSMQDRLAEMTQRAAHTDAEDVLRTAPAFTALESRMAELVERLERSETQQRDLPDVVRSELNQLADRIEAVRMAGESGAEQAHTAAVVAAQGELRDIESRILGLLKEAQATFTSQSATASDLQILRGEIASLHARLDDLASQTPRDSDLETLQAAVEQLSARVAEGPDTRPLDELDGKLALLAEQLERAGDTSQTAPQLLELERRVADLDDRLADALRMQGEGEAVGQLKHQLAEIGERLVRTEQQVGAIETIEQAVHQLYQGLEDNRAFASQVAEEAAGRAAERVLAAARTQLGEPSHELQALREGLAAVRDSAASADQRNQETLVAVHETLEQIVEKLAELETSAAGHQVAASLAQQAAPAPQPQPQPQREAAWTVPPVMPPAAPGPGEVRPASESSFFDPIGAFAEQATAPKPEPAEPFVPELHIQPPAGDPKADLVQPALAMPDPGLEDNDDFIAAARRAAQAAATRSTAPVVEDRRPPKAEPRRSRFSLPFLGRGKRPAPVTYVNGRPLVDDEQRAKPKLSNPVAEKRRKLILAGIVLLAAVSAVTFNLLARSSPPAKQSTSIESPAAKPKGREVVNLQPVAAKQDGVITGSLPAQKTDASLDALIAEPGTAPVSAELPPPETGTLALRQAAARGDAEAQFVIASRYLDGQGVEQNLPEAARWFERAATGGLAPAQYRIGTLLERGKGMPQDIAAALLWYQRAAAAGNVKSMHNAAVILAGNQAGAPDFAQAYRLFKDAAERGLKDSQFNLAVLAERGLGTPTDPGEAYYWYAVAGQQGDKDAARRAAVIAAKLTPQMVAELDAKVQGFKPVASSERANLVAVKNPAWTSAPSAAAAAPAPQNAPETPKTAAQSGPSASANPVLEAQQLLGKLGFNIGEPDGTMGVKTQNAIRLFQLQSGLEVTGEVTPDLLDAMRAKSG